MPRAFDVTASTPAVQLSPGRKGEVTFTVTNALGQPSRVRAMVEPSGDARREWLSLPGGMEKELPPDGTAVFTVKVAVPPDAPPGEYTFKLLVVSVSNPDEHYARGPAVAFTVAAAAPVPAKKPFPWGWVALAAGVVLIVGGVVALVLSRGDGEGTGGSGALPGLSQPCGEVEPRCAEGLVCTEESRCLGGAGFSCGEGGECASQNCVEGECRPPQGLGSACQSDRGCLVPLLCHEGFCLLPDGNRCTNMAQCISGRCEAGTCTARVSPGGRCGQDTDCESPARCENSRCVLNEGALCRGDAECRSGNCQDGLCRPECFPPCGPGLTCSRGRCALVRRHCDDNSDCQSPMRCSEGICRLPSGSPCAQDSQCLSGSCVRSRCR